MFGNLFSKISQILNPREKYRTVLVVALQLVASFLEVASLGLMIPIFDLMINNEKLSQYKPFQYIYSELSFNHFPYFILFLLALVLCVFVLKLIVFHIVNIYSLRLSYDISLRLSKARFYDFYQSDYETITALNSAQVISDIKSLPAGFASGILIPIIGILSEAIVLLLIITGIIIYDYRVFLMLFGTLGLIMSLIYQYLKKKNALVGENITNKEITSNKLVYQGVLGYIDIILHGQKRKFIREYINLLNDVYKLNIKRQVYSLLPGKFIELGAVMGIIVIYFVYLLFNSNPAELFTLLSIFGISAFRSMPSLNRIFAYILSINSTKHILNLIAFNKAYKNTTELTPENASLGSLTFNKVIELKDVSFQYLTNSNFSLRNINLTIPKGTKIGLIGKSGSGKTTLIKLLLGFIKESSGQILVDGNPINEGNADTWRSKLGYVQQGVYLIDGSIKENIAFGLEEIDYARLNKVIGMASLSDFVKNLGQGIDSPLGENASKISGGQKQRIAIGRALYRNAEILIMDEATSALDNETENEITETINSLAKQGITVITIAHRVSTLKYCDVIYEMKDGEIITGHSYNDIIKQIYNVES